MSRYTKDDIKKLLASLLICEGTGLFSAFLSGTADNPWYDTLIKPSWNPPEWIFGPVWSALYLLMGIALWLIWKSTSEASLKKKALKIFSIQLLLNFLWSIIFFRFREPALAIAEIILLWLAILLTLFRFTLISKPASWLLAPYFIWVSFATTLNYAIWSLN